MTPDEAAGKPLADAHSIWEITLHILAWKRFARRGLEGEPLPRDPSPEEDWPLVPGGTGDEAWAATVAELETEQGRLEDLVSRLSDERLDAPAPGRRYTIYVLLHGIIQHDLYHAGQIALLKKAARSV